MFEILAYLFENYFDADGYPDQDTLARKLTAAGFEADDISQALDWLSGLEAIDASDYPVGLDDCTALRCYSFLEESLISPEARGFLMFLESAGILSPMQREMIVDRIVALDEPEIALDKVKLIVLIVLWNQRQPLDTLVLEELLVGDAQQTLH